MLCAKEGKAQSQSQACGKENNFMKGMHEQSRAGRRSLRPNTLGFHTSETNKTEREQ